MDGGREEELGAGLLALLEAGEVDALPLVGAVAVVVDGGGL